MGTQMELLSLDRKWAGHEDVHCTPLKNES